jgi:subtilisin family serine protease
VLVVAAAGNYAQEEPVVIDSYDGPVTYDMSVVPAWPAAIDQVVAVGSVGVKDAGWVISDFSPSGDWVDAVAPGEHVLSLAIGGVSDSPDPTTAPLAPDEGGFAYWWGTSFSTAAVTAMIAKNMRDGESARAAWDRLIAGRPRIKGSGISPGPVLVLPAP